MVRSTLAALSGALAPLRARLKARPDTEHEQALVRIGVTVVMLLYMLPVAEKLAVAGMLEVHYFVGFGILGAAVSLFAAICVWPGPSPVRRFMGMVLDNSSLTWWMVFFGDYALPFFLVYVWVTLANGFRFGPRALMTSLALGTAGFITVLGTSPFWRAHLAGGVGLLVMFVLLSLYIRKLVTALFDAVARAEAANQAKRRFISVVSHEMRTPLNAIIGMADLMRDTSLNREQADMLQTLRSSSRHMLGLVDDVLDFSKIEAGKLVVEKADFELHALVNSTARIVAAQASAKGIDFVTSIMPEVPPAVLGDPHYLRQVLINLAGNAVKFTSQGGVTLHVSSQQETETAVRLKFSIRDTGIGIAPEAVGRIFESFTQAEESTTRRFGGTGLGTTIAKQLVELMGGRIGVESAVGLGSTFWFELALEKQAERAGAGAGELAGARILLVGFPAEDLEAVKQSLTGWGVQPAVAASVEDGIARLVGEISLAKPYHSALLYGSGSDLKLAQRFRRGVPHPAPRTVLAVPRESSVPRFEALTSGFAAVLELPFDKRQLFNVLHSISAGSEAAEGVLRLQDYAKRGAGAQKLNVLVADDNPTNREVVGKILERGGHGVAMVNDGAQALEALERERFDVVILDRNMPGMDGLEALQAMRLMTRASERIPAILFSADATPEAKKEALEAGADVFLAKPVEAIRLLEQIAELTANASSARRAEPAPKRAAPVEPAQESAEIVNHDTLRHLEELGSSPRFLDRLAGVFIADNTVIMHQIEQAFGGRNYHEVRQHLHAMKGSAASMGTDRLTRLCGTISNLSDAEMRLRGPSILNDIAEELGAARSELERYVRERRDRSSG